MVKAKWKTVNIPRRRIATYAYSAPESVGVHEGYTTRNGTVFPSRPWISLTVEQYDFLSALKTRIETLQQTLPFDAALVKAFDDLAGDFGEAMQQNIQNPIWQWPRITERQSGEIVFSPRNIVDLGTLLKSYSLEIV